MKYLTNRSTKWTTGRNLLFTSNIHNINGEYLYFILMDDDICLYWAQKTEGKRFKNLNPWRSFEDFIKRVQPAVAALELGEPPLNRKLEIRRHKNCSTEEEYIPTVWYDAAFNAFHYKAVEHSLPYWDQMENVSIWYSALYNIVWNEVVFRGQVVLYKHLFAYNTLHRPYAKEGRYNNVLPVVLRSIRERIPVQCQNASLLQEYDTKGVTHGLSESSTYCLPPPLPNQAIVPFKNFIC